MSARLATPIAPPSAERAPDHERLARHLIRRLRRRLEKQAIDRAVDDEILLPTVSQVDGVQTRRLIAHPRMFAKTRREIELLMRRFASTHAPGSAAAASISDDDDEYIYRIERDNELAPNPKKRASRAASRGSGPAQLDAARHGRLTAKLMMEVRRAAGRPHAAEVATVLLLARSVTESGMSLADIITSLRAPCPVVSIVASVPGFERCFLHLLREGQILSGAVALATFHELGNRSTVRFSGRAPQHSQVAVFAGTKHDSDDPDHVDRLIDQTAFADCPILGVAEDADRLPERLKSAAQLQLSTGPLDADLVRRLIVEVLGERPAAPLSDVSCAQLTVADLAMAIRPGVSPDRAANVLMQIAELRTAGAEARTVAAGSGEARKSSYTEKRTTKAGRGDPGSGSEIIRPAPVTVTGAGTESDRFIPRVEMLSGYGDATRWALALKADLDLWRGGDLAWEEMSAKLLLSGPPGTGKTTFAKALCNSLQVPLIATSVATWMEPGYFGDVLKRMKAAFAEAEALKPSILFIDELDGIGTRRQRGEWVEYTNGVINRALELLDGAARSTGVIIVAATNHPEMIDPALLRSGRLETHIAIPPPDTDALVGILRHHLKHDLEAVVANAPVAGIAPSRGGSPANMPEIATPATEEVR